MFDVFISHASEDKDDVVYPLVEHLNKFGVSIWLDKFEIKIGDSLREKIDEGLAKSSFGVVILSKHFFAKKWTNRELDSLFAIEENKEKVILPIWHNITNKEISEYSPLLAGKVAVSTSLGMELVAEEIVKALRDKDTIKNFYIKREIDSRNKINVIREKLFLNNNSSELVRLKYELEEYKNKYPLSVEAKILYDDIERAIHWENRPTASRQMKSSNIKLLFYISLIVLEIIAFFFWLN